MEHFTKKVLLPLIALVLSSVPSLAQTIPIMHGTTLDNAASVVTYGIQNVGNASNMAGPGLYVSQSQSFVNALAQRMAANNASAGLTWPATQSFVLEGVLNEGATVGEFFIDQSAEFSNIGAGIIGRDVATESVQAALMEFDVLKITGTSSGGDPFWVLHSSANKFVGWANGPAADLSMVPSDSYIAQARQLAQNAASQSSNMIAAQGDAMSSGTVQTLENAGIQAVKNCGFFCGASLALSGAWVNLKVGLQMGVDDLGAALESSAGIGSVLSAGAIYGGVMICNANLDNLCSNNINTSLSFLLFGPPNASGPTLVSQTFNPYTGALERDYSDGSITWTRNNGINTGFTKEGVGWVQDPVTGEVSLATPIDGQDVRSSQILQVNFSGQTEYVTQAGISLTLDDAQSAVQSINALNSVAYQYPALFQVPAVVPVLDPNGTPTPAAPPDQSGTSTTTGKTPQGNQYTTTVQKDASGNIVAEYTVTTGTNFTTSKDNLTGTSQTIQRNPDGSTTIFNCIQSGTVCASSNGGIVNYDDGWNGNNPYDASNQSFPMSFPGFSGGGGSGGGGGGGPLLNADPTAVNYQGCTELGC